MTEKPAVYETSAQMLETVLVEGDLSELSATERLNYYKAICDSVGLNPLTKPFDYIQLNGRLVLYARKDATDQLRKRDGVSISKLEKENVNGVYVVTAYATTKDGRQDVATGAVTTKGLGGDALANAMMKAETKAKRRVTLSICGLGFLDETETETIAFAQAEQVTVTDTGDIVEPHWIDDPRKRARFWATIGEYGLDEKALKELTGVASIHEWDGTANDLLQLAKAKLSEQDAADLYGPEEAA